MKNKLFTGLLCVFIAGTASSQNKIEFDAYDVYPEGVAYDAGAGVFYVSGVRSGQIGKVNMAGNYTVLYSDTMLRSTYGMKVNGAQKKLWVLAGDPNYSKYKTPMTDKRLAKLISIDTETGKKINDIDLSGIAIGNRFVNDMDFDKSGNIYITDSFSPNIYKVDGSGKASVFATSSMFYAPSIGLNGIVVHPGGYLLAVNSGQGSVLKINMSDPKDIAKVKIDQFFPGGDGLSLESNGSLVLVQNQGVNKVFKLMSSDNWMSAKVTMATKASAMFAQPSTVAMKGADFWIMNSKLNELADSMHVPSRKFSIQKAEFVAVN